ncbi:zinc finger protein Xfin [Alosa sapidissima]|uniref:zinc finger protein Xfin n=1 Tax=Alosa sapidissima TaxID=34773 RepID=UPI001C09539A|nr:zinc finger protein Xfin [Alosa sapidissima]
MEDPFLDYCSSQELAGGADAFICTECGEGFVQYSRLVSHMAIHGSSESFQLDAPSNGLETPIEFVLHKNGTLTVVERLEASNSSLKISDPQSQSTTETESSENGTKVFPCERCGQVFSNQSSLLQHQRYHSLGQGYKCTLCCKVHDDRESLREHLQDHAHERFYSCGHCGKRFLRPETLSTHQKEWHGSLVARNSVKLAKSQENNIGKFYQCKLCELHFFWLSDLQSHLISHSLKKTADTSESVVDEKVSSNPYNSVDRTYRCGLCGKTFYRLSDLMDHHLSHQAKEEKSKTETKATRRTQIDHGYKPFASRQAIYRLDAPRSRRMRGRSRGAHQSSTRLYPCKHCHRVFVHSSSLSRHNRYHKGTLHTCVYCGKHFPQRCDVTRHIAMYHKAELGAAADENAKKHDESPERNASEEQENEKDLDDEQESPVNETSGTKEMPGPPKARLSFKCRECGKVFGLLSVYQRHQRYHKREPARQLHKCSHCRCRFSQLSALERHLKTHDKEAPSEVGKEGLPTVDANKDNHANSEDTDDTVEDEDINVEGDESVNAEILYECTVCAKSFSSMKTFMKHQSEHG